jgi:hypothetical protein
MEHESMTGEQALLNCRIAEALAYLECAWWADLAVSRNDGAIRSWTRDAQHAVEHALVMAENIEKMGSNRDC